MVDNFLDIRALVEIISNLRLFMLMVRKLGLKGTDFRGKPFIFRLLMMDFTITVNLTLILS